MIEALNYRSVYLPMMFVMLNYQLTCNKIEKIIMSQQIELKENEILKINNVRTKIRNVFGIIPISLYTKNFRCNISCIYCPQVANAPKSYLKNEDTKRALRVNYEPDLQLEYWIAEIKKRYGEKKPTKLEIIILGGTFGDLSQTYREYFLKKLYDKLNGKKSKDLSEAIKFNKTAKYRACIITVETRPDTINKNECDFLRKLGVSKVELGIQSIYNDVLKFSGRPYDREKIIEVTAILRSEGFKLGYHIMLNLPLSNIELDNLMLKEINENIDFQPDFLKIYPLTLVKEQHNQERMWELYENGIWKPYNKEQLINLIFNFKKSISEYIRIQRIQRQFDDSDYLYEDFHIRNILKGIFKSKSIECNCIRCQEIKTFKSNINVSTNIVFNIDIKDINKKGNTTFLQ